MCVYTCKNVRVCNDIHMVCVCRLKFHRGRVSVHKCTCLCVRGALNFLSFMEFSETCLPITGEQHQRKHKGQIITNRHRQLKSPCLL